MKTIPISVLWLFAICATPAAQTTTPSHGPFAGCAQGMSVDGGTHSSSGVLSSRALLIKDEGFSTAPPLEINENGFDFRSQTIFGAAGIDIDALSLGWGLIYGDVNGVAVVPPQAWGALNLSVTRGTAGTGVIAYEAEFDDDGAAADVFSYVLPGSSGVAAEFIDKTVRAQDSNEAGLFDGSNKGDVDALDTFIPLFRLDPSVIALLPRLERLYFSVTTESVVNVPPTWWDGKNPSGATIFFVPFTGSGWGQPRPFLTHEQLGLAVDEDVDAFAFDSFRNNVLFSTKTATRDPLLFARLGSSITVSIYKTETGDEVSKRIGLAKPDDLDGICALDPSRDATGFLSHIIGTPLGPIPNPTLRSSPTATASACSGGGKRRRAGQAPRGGG